MARISQRELRNDNAQVIRRVEAGESFVVTRHGVPVADLVPHQETDRRPRWVPARVVTAAFADLPPWDLTGFEQDQATFDELVDDTPRDPWATRG